MKIFKLSSFITRLIALMLSAAQAQRFSCASFESPAEFVEAPKKLAANTQNSTEESAVMAECVAHLRRTMADTTRFWFGDDWRFNCATSAGGGGSHSPKHHRMSSLACFNARDLQPFHNVGGRLFRVNTFTDAFLDEVRFVPRVLFTPRNGEYRACEHKFAVYRDRASWEVGFDTPPIPAFYTRHAPIIDWAELHDTADRRDHYGQIQKVSSDDIDRRHYALLLVDVGAGTLKYLAVDFPHSTRALVEYEQLDNFRLGQPTPHAILVFEQPANKNILAPNPSAFDLSQFMLDNELDDALVGLNWFLVEADAYSIERHRLKGTVDNCHALIRQKLIENHRWKFLEFFLLGEMDASLSISAVNPQADYFACCKQFVENESTKFADPLGDGEIPSSALHVSPTVTSLRPIGIGDNYQRAQRHYIVLKEEKYTLAMFDPTRRYLYWLVVDISAEALSLGDLAKARLIAPYIPPIPNEPGACHDVLFVLFRQPAGVEMTDFYNNDHVFRSRFCASHCHYRNSFEVEQFKSFHRLQFSAISWMQVCYDIFEASRQLQHFILLPNVTMTDERSVHRTRKPSIDGMSAWTSHNVEKINRQKREKVHKICSKILGEEYVESCTSGISFFVTPHVSAILMLISFSIFCQFLYF